MAKLEARAANRLLWYAMLFAASYILMRTVGDSLFLARLGSGSLAYVFVASGIATAIIALLWYAMTRRLSFGLTIKASAVLFALLTFAAWIALPFLHHSWWLLASIYLLTEIKGCVYTINVVTGMNEVLGGHSSRHAWAKIGLGAPLAGLIVGTLVGIEASFIDLRTWLLISAVIDLAAILPLARIPKIKVSRTTSRGSGASAIARGAFDMESMFGNVTKQIRNYACSRQFRFWIGTLILAKVVVLTLVTFYWKVSVNDYFSSNEQSLTRYFAVFYACVGLLTLVIQALFTRRLISRQSLYVPILFMPVGLTILGIAIVFTAGTVFLVIGLTLAKSFEIWRRSVHDTTLNLLYTHIERKKRRNAIAINGAIVKPLAEVGASLVLLFGTAAWQKSVVALGLAVWIVATIALLRLLARTRKLDESQREVQSQKKLSESDIKQPVSGLFNN
jgi:hypothetical protein